MEELPPAEFPAYAAPEAPVAVQSEYEVPETPVLSKVNTSSAAHALATHKPAAIRPTNHFFMFFGPFQLFSPISGIAGPGNRGHLFFLPLVHQKNGRKGSAKRANRSTVLLAAGRRRGGRGGELPHPAARAGSPPNEGPMGNCQKGRGGGEKGFAGGGGGVVKWANYEILGDWR